MKHDNPERGSHAAGSSGLPVGGTTDGPFLMRLDALQPSQLYINKLKLEHVLATWDPVSPDTLEPVPIKELDGRLVLTDGHTRALAAFTRGFAEIVGYWDPDELDWEAYRICVEWCLSEGIWSVSDLSARIVPPEEYDRLWLDRCRRMHDDLATKRGRA
jgi:hypothetical protein